jgi:undecaprenyl-diphosphatase
MITAMCNIDTSILEFIRNNLHTPILDRVMIFFTNIGESGAVWLLIALGLIISKKYRKVGLMMLVALVIGYLLGEGVLKHIFKRERPFTHVPGIELLAKRPKSYSFPSGHTTSSFAAAGILAYSFKKYAPGFYLLAGLIAFSRLYLYMHYPSDVLGGIILGTLSCIVTIYIFKKFIKKKINA